MAVGSDLQASTWSCGSRRSLEWASSGSLLVARNDGEDDLHADHLGQLRLILAFDGARRIRRVD